MTTNNQVERKKSAKIGYGPLVLTIGILICIGVYYMTPSAEKLKSNETSITHTPNQNDLSAKETAVLLTGTLLTTTKTTDLGNGKVQVDIDYPGWKKCTVKLEASNNPQTSAYLVSESSCKKTELKND